jgi:hypothetical protein
MYATDPLYIKRNLFLSGGPDSINRFLVLPSAIIAPALEMLIWRKFLDKQDTHCQKGCLGVLVVLHSALRAPPELCQCLSNGNI